MSVTQSLDIQKALVVYSQTFLKLCMHFYFDFNVRVFN